MLNLSEYAARPRLLADYLPWACLVAPGVLLNKDGSFQTSLRYRGPDLESSTEAELVAISARINNVLRRFGSGWALFFEAARREAAPYPECPFPDAVSWLIDEERAVAAEEAGARYESDYYLTLLWLPPEDLSGHAGRALITRPESGEGHAWRRRLEEFRQQAARAFDLLAAALPDIAWLNDGETLNYLHSTISTKRHPVAVPDLPVFLDAVLADEPFTGGLAPMIGAGHIRTLSILGFPGSTLPGLLDELNRQGFAYRWMTRFIALDKAEAEKLLSKKRRHWAAKRKSVAAILRETMFNEPATLLDNDADNKARDADAALQELGSDLVAYGYVTTTVTVIDEDPGLADEHARILERIINGRGFTVISETLNAVDAWLGSLPGHPYANVRQPVLHTLNLAHMLPVPAVWAGEARNAHLGGPALIEARTDGTTPFRVNLHTGDVGHTLIVGPTGAGKSVLLSMLALQWRRYRGAQVFIFDKGRSARATTLALGGAHIGFSPETAPQLQPLRDIGCERGAGLAADWLHTLLEAEGLVLTPDLKARLWEALTALASAPPKERTLTGLSLMLQDTGLRAALAPYTLEGPLGGLLDADADTLSLVDTVCFEMEELMHLSGAALPVLTHLFNRLEDRFDGRPTLLILDEAWLFLDHTAFAARIREWLKTLRKKNVAVVFATQSLADVTDSVIAPALIGSCPTRIFLPDARAGEPQMREAYARFGLNARQTDLIARATPKRDYYLQSPGGARLFELGLGPVALAFAGAGSPGDQKRIDAVLAAAWPAGFAPAWLNEQGLPWAAELLASWPGAAVPGAGAPPSSAPPPAAAPPAAPPSPAAAPGLPVSPEPAVPAPERLPCDLPPVLP